MATLVLASQGHSAAAGGETETVSLRAWLREGWAVLFSHPDDFVRCAVEMDRWLALVQRAFAATRIRPLALASPAVRAVSGWIAAVSGDLRTVLLSNPLHRHGHTFDLRAAALRADIQTLGRQRFVMVVDDGLYNRRTFTYGTLAEVPSPLEFLGWADAVRSRQPHFAAIPAAGHRSWGRRPRLGVLQD